MYTKTKSFFNTSSRHVNFRVLMKAHFSPVGRPVHIVNGVTNNKLHNSLKMLGYHIEGSYGQAIHYLHQTLPNLLFTEQKFYTAEELSSILQVLPLPNRAIAEQHFQTNNQ